VENGTEGCGRGGKYSEGSWYHLQNWLCQCVPKIFIWAITYMFLVFWVPRLRTICPIFSAREVKVRWTLNIEDFIMLSTLKDQCFTLNTYT